jgi:hypothetical protein
VQNECSAPASIIAQLAGRTAVSAAQLELDQKQRCRH